MIIVELWKPQAAPRFSAKKGAYIVTLRTMLMISDVIITWVRYISKSVFDQFSRSHKPHNIAS